MRRLALLFLSVMACAPDYTNAASAFGATNTVESQGSGGSDDTDPENGFDVGGSGTDEGGGTSGSSWVGDHAVTLTLLHPRDGTSLCESDGTLSVDDEGEATGEFSCELPPPGGGSGAGPRVTVSFLLVAEDRGEASSPLEGAVTLDGPGDGGGDLEGVATGWIDPSSIEVTFALEGFGPGGTDSLPGTLEG